MSHQAHFIFKDDILIGDGMTTAIKILSILLIEGKKLSELRKGIDLFEVLEINQRIDKEKFFQNEQSIYRKLNLLLKNQKLFFNIRPSGTEPLLRVNLQYLRRNIKLTDLKKIENKIRNTISNAC